MAILILLQSLTSKPAHSSRMLNTLVNVQKILPFSKFLSALDLYNTTPDDVIPQLLLYVSYSRPCRKLANIVDTVFILFQVFLVPFTSFLGPYTCAQGYITSA